MLKIRKQKQSVMIKENIKETMRSFKNKNGENFLNEEDNSITQKCDYKKN